MSKYDKMIALNKMASEEKIERAKREIFHMQDEGEKVTVQRLMEKTGLSRGFFYKNTEVRRAIDRALEQQAGIVDPKRSILDMAMNSEIETLRQQLSSLKAENEKLRSENERLQKALGKKNLNLIKNL